MKFSNVLGLKIMILLAILVYTPIAKRYFDGNEIIYVSLTALPFLFFFSKKLSRYQVVVMIIALLLLTLNFLYTGILYYQNLFLFIPLCLIAISSPRYMDNALNFKRIILIASISFIYAVYQKVYGYTQFELSWIRSGSSVIAEEGYFITEDVRPFSTLSGVPELAFLAFFVMLVSYEINSKIWFFIAFSILFLSASRGMIISVLVCSFIYKMKINGRNQMLMSMILSALIYFSLPYFLFLIEYVKGYGPDGRLMVFGTYLVRQETFISYLSALDIASIILPFSYESKQGYDFLLDNFYLRFVNDYGFTFLLIFIAFAFIYSKNKNISLIVSVYLSYGWYAEVQYGFYFNTMVAILIYLFRCYEVVGDESFERE